jgi:hypothetical protein
LLVLGLGHGKCALAEIQKDLRSVAESQLEERVHEPARIPQPGRGQLVDDEVEEQRDVPGDLHL